MIYAEQSQTGGRKEHQDFPQPQIQLMSDRDDPDREERYIASVFIEVDAGQFELDHKLFEHQYKACGSGNNHKATCFSDGDLWYFVICCDMTDLDSVTNTVKRELQTAP